MWPPTIEEETRGPEARDCVSHHRGIVQPVLPLKLPLLLVDDEQFAALVAGDAVAWREVVVELVQVDGGPLPAGRQHAHGQCDARQGWNVIVAL